MYIPGITRIESFTTSTVVCDHGLRTGTAEDGRTYWQHGQNRESRLILDAPDLGAVIAWVERVHAYEAQ